MPPLRTLSPRYTQKGSSPMNDSAHRIAWAMPAGNPWTTYVIRTPWALPSPRSSCTFSGMRSPRITPMSVMPASRRSSRQYRMFGLFASGISCFGPVWVSGRSRVPCPPAKRHFQELQDSRREAVRERRRPDPIRGHVDRRSVSGRAEDPGGEVEVGIVPAVKETRARDEMVGGCREDGVLARELRLPEAIHGPRDVLFAVPPFRPVEDEVRRDEQIPRPDVRRDPGKGARRSGIHLPCEVPLLLASVHVVHRLGVDDRRRLRLADEDHALLHVLLGEFDEVDAGMPRLRSGVGGNDLERFAGKGRDRPAQETVTAQHAPGLRRIC